MNDKSDHPATPFTMERLLRAALRHEKSMEAASEAEFLDNLDESALTAIRDQTLAEDPKEQAQELAFQAYECGDRDDARDLVAKALAADPQCLDALTVKAFLESDDAGALITALEEALDVGESALGEEFFAEYMGDFWGMVEARPYLRTTKQLAELLWSVGRRFDAVAYYENLMELDPDDHMGGSSLLLGFYLSMGEVQRSWDLLEECDTGTDTVYAWSWVLLFLLIGDEAAAADGLQHAMELNPYVAQQLVGLGDEPDDENPPTFKPGSQEEAWHALDVIGDAWGRAGEAQMWLFQTLSEMGLVEVEDEDEDDEGLLPN